MVEELDLAYDNDGGFTPFPDNAVEDPAPPVQDTRMKAAKQSEECDRSEWNNKKARMGLGSGKRAFSGVQVSSFGKASGGKPCS